MKYSLITVSLFTTSFLLLGFKQLDPEKQHPLLSRIASELDIYDIDVVADWRSNITLEGNPVLAPIANYPISVLGKESKWEKEFKDLYSLDAMVGIKSSEPVEAVSFVEQWDRQPVNKRIFISFAREDLEHAELIKLVLEDQGYGVFIYSQSNGIIFKSPEMIVHCMKTAGEVLVLDTKISRNKSGVLAEALAFAKYTYRPESEIIDENKKLLIEISKRMAIVPIERTDQISKSYVLDKLRETFPGTDAEIEALLKKNGRDDLDVYTGKNAEGYIRSTYVQYLSSVDLPPYTANKLYKESLINIGNATLENPLKLTMCFGLCPVYKIPIILCPICSPFK